MTSPILLVAADIGNINLKFRPQGGPWTVEPALVRLSRGETGYQFGRETAVRPLIYLSGPAGIEPGVPYLVGGDAQRTGVTDPAVIGSAELRVQTSAYLLLHLYAIIASLPLHVTTASVAFAGGLPVTDDANPQVRTTLRQRLTGKTTSNDPAVPHVLRWGETIYTITVLRTSFTPQPIGAIATLLFTPDGRIQLRTNVLRQRFALDIGGGTTDFTGRRGLDLIPGTEGGVRLGVHDAAETARALVQRRFPQLTQLSSGQILASLRGDGQLFVAGAPCDIREELRLALHDTASALLAQIVPRWERSLAEGEVLLFGGGGQLMADAITAVLAPIAPVHLLPDPLTRVADGIERLAKYRLQQE